MTDISKETFEISGGSLSAATAEKPPAPVVEWPKSGGVYVNHVRFAGTCLEGASVEISTSPSSWEAVPAVGTNWSCVLDSLPPSNDGYENVQVRQTVKGVVSDVRQVPAFILRPTSLPLPVVAEPLESSSVILGGSVHFQGTCLAGAEVGLWDLDGNLLVRANVTGTTWSCDHTFYQQEVKFIKVMQAIDDKTSSAVRRWILVVRRDTDPKIKVTTPIYQSDTYRKGDFVYFGGTCTPGSGMGNYVWVVDKNGGPIDMQLPVVGGRWGGLVGPMAANASSTNGHVPLLFISHDGGANKEFRGSTSFRVYVGDANAPLPPVITEPVSGDNFQPGIVNLKGSCEEGARVRLNFVGLGWHFDETVTGNTWHSTANLDPGDYSIVTKQHSGGVESSWSDVVKFSVT